MRTIPIGIQNFSAAGYNRLNHTKKQYTPSFQSTYDYDNKPVPPAGKIVTALSALGIISGMVYTAKDRFNSGENNEPQTEIVGDSIQINNVYPHEYNKYEGIEDEPEKEEEEKAPVQRPQITDSISSDSTKDIEHTHTPDTMTKEHHEVIGNFNGTAYKVISKGDTVILVPMIKNSHKEINDSTFTE